MAQRVKAIFYGDYGIGKTTVLASGVGDKRFDKGLLLNVEGGTLSIASRVNEISVKDVKEGKVSVSKGLDTVSVRDTKDLDAVLTALYRFSDKGEIPWNSLMVDSLTEVNRLVLLQSMRDNYEKTGKGDSEVPQLQDYGRSNVRMNDLIRDFRDLDMNVFFTALSSSVKDELTGGIQMKPNFTGRLQDEIPAMVDIVGYLYIGKDGTREVRFQPSDRISAKDRSEGGRLGTIQKNITLPKFFDLLEFGHKEEEIISLPEALLQSISDALPDPIHEPTGRKARK